jgi:tRNA A37 N6-isopentenylltransferase MiaA
MPDLAERLNAAIDNGFTVQVTTYLRAARVTPKSRNAWRAAGYEAIKHAADGTLLMIAGQTKGKPRYEAILSSCKIEAFR